MVQGNLPGGHGQEGGGRQWRGLRDVAGQAAQADRPAGRRKPHRAGHRTGGIKGRDADRLLVDQREIPADRDGDRPRRRPDAVARVQQADGSPRTHQKGRARQAVQGGRVLADVAARAKGDGGVPPGQRALQRQRAARVDGERAGRAAACDGDRSRDGERPLPVELEPLHGVDPPQAADVVAGGVEEHPPGRGGRQGAGGADRPGGLDDRRGLQRDRASGEASRERQSFAGAEIRPALRGTQPGERSHAVDRGGERDRTARLRAQRRRPDPARPRLRDRPAARQHDGSRGARVDGAEERQIADGGGDGKRTAVRGDSRHLLAGADGKAVGVTEREGSAGGGHPGGQNIHVVCPAQVDVPGRDQLQNPARSAVPAGERQASGAMDGVAALHQKPTGNAVRPDAGPGQPDRAGRCAADSQRPGGDRVHLRVRQLQRACGGVDR